MAAAGTVGGSNQPGTNLLSLAASAGFSKLTAAETELLTKAGTGDWANCAGAGPPSIASWKRDARRIDAALLQWLCIDGNAAQKVSRQGLWIWGAKIEGALDLSYVQVSFPLVLHKCIFTDPINIYSARLPSLSLTGSHIPSLQGDRVHIQADLTLNEKFRARKGIQLFAAEIGGSLSCWGGRFFGGQEKVAINGTHINVKGSIFLDEDCRTKGEVRLYDCKVGEDLSCVGGTLKNPGGPALYATNAKIAKDVRLDRNTRINKDFTAEGTVSFLGAEIGGDLNCSGAKLSNPPVGDVFNGGVVLNASAAHVSGKVYLDEGFTADGQVTLNLCKIGKACIATGGTFRYPGYTALDLESAEISGPVILKNATVEGEARFYSAQIAGDIDCTETSVSNPDGKDDTASLNLVRAIVRGSCRLVSFHAEGEMQAYGTQIGGDFFAPAAVFHSLKAPAIDAQNLRVSGDVHVVQSTVDEEFRLIGAQISGDLDCSGGTFSNLNLQRADIKGTFRACKRYDKNAELLYCDLTNASTAILEDEENSWPKQGGLVLDGFHYRQISGPSRDAKARVRWLALQTSPADGANGSGQDSEFFSQPYRQLAKVLSDTGDDDGSKEVLYEMEARFRQQGATTFRKRVGRSIGNAILRETIGYGVYPMRALWWLVALTLLATAVYAIGYLNGSVTPSDKEAYAQFEKQGQPPPYYPNFNAFIYSVENTFPLLHFGQDSAWSPNSGARTQARRPDLSSTPLGGATAFVAHSARWFSSPSFLIWFHWFEICIGWILATLFVAGFSGIVQRS
jgi:hypothetical protein